MSDSLVARVVALGFFDGVHRGHAAILDRAAALARERGWGSAAVTFETHPRAFVLGVAPDLITTIRERADLIRAHGVGLVVALPFDGQTANTSPEEFADMLRTRWGAQTVVCGENFRFGRNAMGTPDTLRACGLECVVCPPVRLAGAPVSSTRVRDCVRRGSMGLARRLLGRPFSMAGTVRGGYRLGRRLGYPTVNLLPAAGMLIPRCGVYATRVQTGGAAYAAVTNVGTRPTFSDAGIVSVESYLLDFSGDLYGADIRVQFLKYLRAERGFASPDALREQIALDVERAREAYRKEGR